MKNQRRFVILVLVVSLLTLGSSVLFLQAKANAQSFSQMFSIPREPATALMPGQFFELPVPAGKKAIITDIYVKGLEEGATALEILEQRSPIAYEVRYHFDVVNGQTLVLNFKTGLKLGDEAPITAIRIRNVDGGVSNIMARVNGYFVR